MKKSLLLLAGALLFSVSTIAQSINFEKLPSQPDGCSSISQIVGDLAGNYYAAAPGDPGFYYHSTDGGNHWQKVDEPTTQLILDPNGVLYRLSNDTLFRSNDHGITWTDITPSGITHITSSLKITSTGTLLISCIPDGYVNANLYRSADQGANWSNSYQNLGHIYTANDGAVYAFKNYKIDVIHYTDFTRSDDDGISWQHQSTIIGPSYAVFRTASGRLIMFAGGTPDKLRYSDDNGVIWNSVDLSDISSYLVDDIFQMPSGEIYVTSNTGSAWHSSDDGISWTAFSPFDAEEFHGIINDFWKMPDGTVFINLLGALYKANDATLTNWSFASYGMTEPNIGQLLVQFDQHIFAATSGGLFKTGDGGNTWSHFYKYPIYQYPLNSGHNDRSMFCFDNNGNILLSDLKFLWRIDTITGARTNITPPDIIPPAQQIASVMTLENGDLMVGSSQASYISHDNGNTWLQFTGSSIFIEVLDAYPVTDTLYYLTTSYGRVYKYNPTTSSITPLVLPFTMFQEIIDGIYVDEAKAIHIVNYDEPDYCVSHDFGNSWQCQEDPNTIFYSQWLVVNTSGYIFNANEDGIFESVDGGAYWNVLYATPPYSRSIFQDFVLSPSQYLYFALDGKGIYRSNQPTTTQALLKGRVFNDAAIGDCEPEDSKPSMVKVKTTASGIGGSYVSVSNAYGEYTMLTTVGNVSASAVPPSEYWQACENTVAVPLTGGLVDSIQLGLTALVQCPKLEVTVAAPFLRRCFESTVYVDYCNTGTQPAISATVDVVLDDYLEFLAADVPLFSQNDQALSFLLGDVDAGQCGKIKLTVLVSCEAALGQLHCVKTHIFPDEDCLNNWSGPWLETSATCNDSTFHFSIHNRGGAMTSPTTYTVKGPNPNADYGYETIGEGPVLLGAGDTLSLDLPKPLYTGYTYFNATQAMGFPYGPESRLYLNSCGVGGLPFEMILYNDNYDWDYVLCQRNRGSFDPNDKSATPPGLGHHDYLDPSSEIEYQIQFQNTGTDTAFTVVIRDELSPLLQMTSIRPTTSSHPYFMEINGRELVFRFANINLPDSSINEPASHGFVRFRIQLKPNAPLGEDLNNKAAIYFDFNDPIWTNNSHYTIGLPQALSTHETRLPALSLHPNPSSGYVAFDIPNWVERSSLFIAITDVTGRTIRLRQLESTAKPELNLHDLTTGVYFLSLKDGDGSTLAVARWIKI
ncbi:MAG: T9SS type A sorting domain-containing protein [Saprospiraceae bacterium]|nr:T9SS type A sorting domain-containing protein [Saprospiraceae bacterium]